MNFLRRHLWETPMRGCRVIARIWHTCPQQWLNLVLLVSGAPVVWWEWTTDGWMPFAVLGLVLAMHEEGRRWGVRQGVDLVKKQVTAVLERKP